MRRRERVMGRSEGRKIRRFELKVNENIRKRKKEIDER